MENIKNVCREIEEVLMDICARGLKETDDTFVVGKLKDSISKASELKMETGEDLIKEFIVKYRKFKDSTIEVKEMAKSLMALDFYIKNIIYYEDNSEL
ncbi:MAG: hypothetical protein LBP76_07260 [Treponema sp.]|jgi:hypothetical protein|nr:hypothetical protein [Treponema sp.]